MQKVYGLNIHLYAFKLNHDLYHNKEKIRVSITTLPELKKQHFSLKPKYTQDANHFFSVNITDQTKKIVFVFRKKSIIKNNPIIASTIIERAELPKSSSSTYNTEIKSISIFEPMSKIEKENKKKVNFNSHMKYEHNSNRQIVGQMDIQFHLTDPFPEESYNNKSKKNNSNKDKYEKWSNNENTDANALHIK